MLPKVLRVTLMVATVAVLVGILMFLYAKTRALDAEGEVQLEGYLRQLKQLDAEWNVDVLKSRMEIHKNYDPLTNPLASLASLQEKLAARLKSVNDLGTEQALNELKSVFDEKIDLVDQFKSQNAILKNSLRYVPTAINELHALIHANRPASQAKVDNLVALDANASQVPNDVLIYNLLPEASTGAKVQTVLTQIEHPDAPYPEIFLDPVRNLVNHTRTILRQRVIENELLNKISAVPMTQKIDRLGEVFDKDFQAALARSYQYRNFLLAYSGFLLLLLAYIASRLFRSYRVIAAVNKDLKNANETLENRVQERTEERQRIQADLEANELHFRALVETSGDIVWAVDRNGCYTYVNGPAVEAIMGYRAEDIIGSPFTQFAAPASAQAFDDEFFRLKEQGGQLHVDGEYYHSSGCLIYLSINAIALRDDLGNFCGASGTAVDVSNIKAVEVLLRETLARQDAILNSATIGIAFVQGGNIVHCNAELERMFGHPPAGLMEKPIEALCVVEGAQARLSTVNVANDGRRIFDSDHICQRRDASRFWCHLSVRAVKEGSPEQGTIWVVQDISDRKQKEQVIEHNALHDGLTGLPNRVLLRDRLEQAVSHAARAKLRFGVLFIDLDRFKMVNDTIGHDGGDQLLRTVAERLRMCVRSEDTVSRQGGDEFIVVLPGIHTSEHIEMVAQKILHDLAKPIPIFGNDYVVTGSIGISIYPEHGKDVQSLLRHADAAMYLAKEVGKNTYRVFTEELDLHTTEEIRLENFLRKAIEREQLDVYYQPRIDLATGRVNSLEALARWRHPELGWVSPAKFIAVAERAGLINRLGDWVLRRACKDMTCLSALGDGDFRLSVNVSRRQFTQPGLVANVCKILAEYGLNPRRLELELTESTIAQDTDQALRILRSFEAAGIGIGIDDFGTGYSSLSQLKRFPIRTLKIDRSFVAGLPGEHDDVAIALAVITMAKQLRMLIVAEGVETPEQRQFLIEHGCDEGQGFLFGRPAPLSEIVKLLDSGAMLATSDRTAKPHERSEDQFRRFLSSLAP